MVRRRAPACQAKVRSTIQRLGRTTKPFWALGFVTISSSQSNASFLELSSDRQILVVDDAALMRRRIESGLSPQGYEVATCDDGMDAWQWLQRHGQPALLITDIEMPRMDGFTLIDRCRQAGLDMPILVISSRLAEEWSRETARLGATDYLTKGFSTSELVNKVSSLLELRTLA